MDGWFSKDLGDGMTAWLPLREIEDRLGGDQAGSGRAAGMAVLVRHEPGPLHCRIVAYFSPAAADLARSMGAEPCPRPSAAGLELLAGDGAVRASLGPRGAEDA